ncbi:hypothetical protein BN2537_13783 [Streptomyces venezuelae]|nr:hypothetical protein BN2537_13783 [Streptomyces venezuelae]
MRTSGSASVVAHDDRPVGMSSRGGSRNPVPHSGPWSHP